MQNTDSTVNKFILLGCVEKIKVNGTIYAHLPKSNLYRILTFLACHNSLISLKMKLHD